MAKMINTVCGPVPARNLGVTHAHEHFLYGYVGHIGDRTLGAFDYDRAKREGLAVLAKLKEQGVGTVVDATPNDQGRNVRFLKELSAESGVNIICATGLYNEACGNFQHQKLRAMVGYDVAREICDMMVEEITHGIEQTEIRAGVIKVATGPQPITDIEKMIFKAAGTASKLCGVPVMTHTECGLWANEQVDMLLDAGADPKRIIIGHLCDTEVPNKVLARGVNIAFDRFGLVGEFGRSLGCPEDEVKIDHLIQLINDGWEDRIVISSDFVVHTIGRPIEFGVKEWNMSRIHEFVLPALREKGVSERVIQKLLVENPRRIYGGE